ncbi:DNA-directed RNA polymerase subunit D [Striga asiatica]|uniref:DNA-directed RNA polymerase subunit D n=1 Tax=Striga asiatica TaxID=4170 RepID=A0A5A7PTH6_STRAF|nr:DNA-directed RNA polymerase subunit D [Striga asiatica]
MWRSASMFGPRVHRLLALILLFVLLLGDRANGSRKSRKASSVFSLFNLKEKSRFWSESVMRSGFDDLESSKPDKHDAINYTKAGNIASYLKLLEVESMYLPVPVNFIFIGFEGNGNREFKLNAEEIERWFTKIDHIFEHTRTPKIGESLTPFYKTSVDREERHHLPVISHINYNFSVHAVQMGEKVTSIFERAIDVFGRWDDVSHSRDDGVALWQVDVDMMGVLFTSLVEYLQLEDAYNIFILNPKNGTKRAKYGYRRGLSETEINFLKENKSLQARILQSGKIPETVLALDKIKRPLYAKHPMSKFSWTVTEETDTIEWHNNCQEALNNVEKLYHGKDTADIVQSKVLQFLNGKNDDLKLFSEKDLKSGDFSGWAFIDLTAGPFSWGPSVGGEGVRTELSLPNVDKTIGAVTEISEDEAEDRLQEAIQEKFAVFGENDHNPVDILLAEIDIYELFAFKHCKGRKVKLALCEELDERMQDLKKELQSVESEEYEESHKQKAIDALKRMENWNLFSDTHEEFQNYTVARDTFLSHLGATLWGSLRHIISPSLADGAFHYYDKISFELFFITQEKTRHIKQLPLDLKSLMEGLSSLVLPSQKVQFSQHMLPLSEDPALAMAFSVARRAAAVPLLLVNGTYRRTVRSYLDSSILQHQLQRLHDHASLKGSHAHSRSTLEIPIFWFIHGEALLVDKHYQAKSLSDMVVVVQSEPSSWESHLQCNGQSLLWDLRRPIKAALAAVSEHIAGLLPLHLVYSQAHETAIEDWIWSVGCNPLSVTSQGWQMSKFQTDTIARSYILTTLEESIQLVNSAIHLLVMERTSEQTFKLFQSHERELKNKYNYVVSLWRRISTVSGELRYADALRLLNTLEDATKGFSDYVNSTVASLHPIHCTRQRKVEVQYDMTTIPAFLVVILVLWFVLKPRRPKPKIN